jgi:hypothetical protein
VFIVDVVGGPSLDRPVCAFDLEVDGAVFRFRLVGVPPESPTDAGLPPLDPVVRSLAGQIELDAETGFVGRILAFEKRVWIDVGNDFVWIPPRRVVPDGLTAAGVSETVVDASKEFGFNGTPDPEYRAHDGSPRAFTSNIGGDLVGE